MKYTSPYIKAKPTTMKIKMPIGNSAPVFLI